MISILLPDLAGGGAERVMIDLALELAREGYEVEFLVMRAQGDFFEVVDGHFPVFELGARRVLGVPLKLNMYLRRRRPKYLIANMWPLTCAAVIGKALALSGTFILVLEHIHLTQQYGDKGILHRAIMAFSISTTYRLANCVAAVSEGAADDLARWAKFQPDRVVVLNNPVPTRAKPDLPRLQAADDLWGCAPGRRILTVGSLKDQKNHRVLLEAFSRMNSQESRLMLVGEGANKSSLQRLSEDLGMADRVIFAGFHRDPYPLYHTADLFVLSSDYEGLPTVLIEALSCGLRVVSTDCPSGPREILKGGKFGHLVPVGDAEALCEAIDAALKTSIDPGDQIRRAREFSPEISLKKYKKALNI